MFDASKYVLTHWTWGCWITVWQFIDHFLVLFQELQDFILVV